MTSISPLIIGVLFFPLKTNSLTPCIRGCKCVLLDHRGAVQCIARLSEHFQLPQDLPERTTEFTLRVYDDQWAMPNQIFIGESWKFLIRMEITGIRTNWQMHRLSLQNLVGLKYLSIQDCALTAIEPMTFKYLSNIEHLDVSRNAHLSYEHVALGLMEFQSTTLSVLNVSGIHNIENTAIATMTQDFLKNLRHSRLKVLDLSWSRLGKIITPLVPFLLHLEAINISGTCLLGRSDCFAELAFLPRIIVIEANYWPSLARRLERRRPTRAVSDSDQTQETRWQCNYSTPLRLVVDGCYIMPPTLRIASLNHLDIISAFWDFNGGVCVHPNNSLTHVSARGTYINNGKITGWHRLEILDFTNVVFGELDPSILWDFPSLIYLHLAGTDLWKLEEMGTLSQLLKYNERLQFVDISRNDLTSVPGNFLLSNLHLQFLNLSGNKLEIFNLDLSQHKHLTMIDLSYNVLKTIDMSVFTTLDKHLVLTSLNTTSLLLSHNDFVCDCSFVDSLNWLLTTDVVIPDKLQLTCTRERTIVSIQPGMFDEMDCSPVPFETVIMVTVVVVVVLLVTVGVLTTVAICLYRSRNQIDRYIDTPLDEFPVLHLAYIVHLDEGHEYYQFVTLNFYPELKKQLRDLVPDHIYTEEFVLLNASLQREAGRVIHEVIHEAMLKSRVTVVVPSEEWNDEALAVPVEQCWYAARQAMDYNRKVIIVSIDDNVKIPRDIRRSRFQWPRDRTEPGGVLSNAETDVLQKIAKCIAQECRVAKNRTGRSVV